MNKYTATFSDGKTIKRSTKREYAVAWRIQYTSWYGSQCEETGFSASREQAQQAARPNLPFSIDRRMSSNDKAEAKRKNAEYLATANVVVEIVPAQIH